MLDAPIPPSLDAPPIISVVITPVANPDAACRQPQHGPEPIVGCAQVQGAVCAVVIPRDGSAAFRWRVLKHELAHCNGWKHP